MSTYLIGQYRGIMLSSAGKVLQKTWGLNQQVTANLEHLAILKTEMLKKAVWKTDIHLRKILNIQMK
jgi:hypothetical protein